MTDTIDTTDALTAELTAFCETNKLPLMSADELAFEPEARPHRSWLFDFCRRWEVAQDAEDAAARVKPQIKTLEIGARVKTVKDIENYPVIYLEAGATGTLADISEDGSHWVTLDEVHPELAEWDNQIQIWDWSEQDGPGESAASYLEAL